MTCAWRIIKAKHLAGAFSGEGAAKFGGRWNSKGVAVVYTSGSKALAALESLVHLNPPVMFRYIAIRVEFDEGLVEHVRAEDLSIGWNGSPPSRASQWVGDSWVREARSAVLSVPSVLVSGEPNYLLNPYHADFGRVRIGSGEDFAFDPRLVL